MSRCQKAGCRSRTDTMFCPRHTEELRGFLHRRLAETGAVIADETAEISPGNYDWLTRKWRKPPKPERLCPDCGANLDPDQDGIVSMGHGEHYEDCDASQG